MKLSAPQFEVRAPRATVIIVVSTVIICAILAFQPAFWIRGSINELNETGERELRQTHGNFSSIWYWTPHKTSSSSLRGFLKRVAPQIDYDLYNVRETYVYGMKDCLKSTLSGTPRRIYIGHCHIKNTNGGIHAPMIPMDTLSLSSIRNPFDVMTSKYFHRTAEELVDPKVFADIRSPESRYWYFQWHDYNRCEPLEYYDGDMNCDLNNLEERIEKISEVVDCVIDADDADPDLHAICEKFKVPRCPRQIQANVHGAPLYSEIHQYWHIREILANASGPTMMLYNRLKEKRCRTFLADFMP